MSIHCTQELTQSNPASRLSLVYILFIQIRLNSILFTCFLLAGNSETQSQHTSSFFLHRMYVCSQGIFGFSFLICWCCESLLKFMFLLSDWMLRKAIEDVRPFMGTFSGFCPFFFFGSSVPVAWMINQYSGIFFLKKTVFHQ